MTLVQFVSLPFDVSVSEVTRGVNQHKHCPFLTKDFHVVISVYMNCLEFNFM